MADYWRAFGQNPCVATIEGDLLVKWRKELGLTQEELAKLCRPQAHKNRISDIERKDHRLTVDTVQWLIGGLEATGRAHFPREENYRLAQFFRGPGEHEARRRLAAAARGILALEKGLKPK